MLEGEVAVGLVDFKYLKRIRRNGFGDAGNGDVKERGSSGCGDEESVIWLYGC